MSATYRAIEVTRPGKFSEVVDPSRTPVPARCAFALKRAVSATRIQRPSMESFPVLFIRTSRATRSSVA